MVNTNPEPDPDPTLVVTENPAADITREEIFEALDRLGEARLDIDGYVREHWPRDYPKQAKEAKRLGDLYSRIERKYRDKLRDYAVAERLDLYEIGGRDYEMLTRDGNLALTFAMDEVRNYAERAKYELRDRIASQVREAMTNVGENHPEIWDAEVREAIYQELVSDGIVKAFEPLDF